jgi:hypothetical protein
MGVEDDAATVNVLEKVGRAEAGLNEHDAPDGNPEAQESWTDSDGPLSKLTVILFPPEPPWATLMPPELDIEKSRGSSLARPNTTFLGTT